MRRAQIPIATKLFHEVFKIPTGVEISGVHWDFDTDAYVLYVRGNELPDHCETPEGGVSLKLTPYYRQNADGSVRFEGWWEPLPEVFPSTQEVEHASR